MGILKNNNGLREDSTKQGPVRQKTCPLISYYGGKQRMAPSITPLIPPHTVYCEPFAGGAAIFYAKARPATANKDHYREVLNDINGDLMNMYMVAKKSPISFCNTIRAIPYSIAAFHGSKYPVETSEGRAIAYYTRINQAFSNNEGMGWSRATTSRNSAARWFSRKARMQSAAERLDWVFLDSAHFSKVIKQWDSPQTFFYIDPPYTGAATQGLGAWTAADQEELVQILSNCQGSWILSGYCTTATRLPGTVLKQIRAYCSASGRGRVRSERNHGEKLPVNDPKTENLTMRGPTVPVRSSLIPVLERQTCFTGPLLGPCPLPLRRTKH